MTIADSPASDGFTVSNIQCPPDYRRHIYIHTYIPTNTFI